MRDAARVEGSESPPDLETCANTHTHVPAPAIASLRRSESPDGSLSLVGRGIVTSVYVCADGVALVLAAATAETSSVELPVLVRWYLRQSEYAREHCSLPSTRRKTRGTYTLPTERLPLAELTVAHAGISVSAGDNVGKTCPLLTMLYVQFDTQSLHWRGAN